VPGGGEPSAAGALGPRRVETFSVLTRLPGARGVDGPTASELLAALFPEVLSLGSRDTSRLFARLGAIGIVGGAVYDALVGESARVNRYRLLTRDGRARRTYDLLGVDSELVGLSGG